jgi:colanic acid/amylovoran biosynthesis glycosyltransferase
MKSKKLLIVTTAYPYGKGESFLKAELEHISKYFEEIELVPCCYTANATPRNGEQHVNLDYAAKRWGFFRKIHLLSSFAIALCRYKWLDDLFCIFRHDHKYENLKELARTLYRAQLFEDFLKTRIIKGTREFDLIYFYWMIPEIMGAIHFRKNVQPGLKIVSRAHNCDLYIEQREGGYIGLRDSIVHGIDEIYCISDHGRSYLENRYPSLAKKLRIARLGTNDPGYLNVQPSDNNLSIVSCSFIVSEKRLHLIVETIEYLLNTNPSRKIKWTHIGDAALYHQLQAYASERIGGRTEVVFKGYLTNDQVMDLYRKENFDVFVNVSDSEGIPVSLMEASSFGIPMIATNVGGNSEIVNSDNGILVCANPDIETIASALIRFTDKPVALEYRNKARSEWKKRFNAAINHDRFGKQLGDVLENRSDVT